jgi:carboxymethylenebutenolidase
VTDLGALGRYILEEWAEEYRHGEVSRREFFRRVAIFGGDAARAAMLLTTLGVAASPQEVAAAATAAPPSPDEDLRPRAALAAAPIVPPDDPSLDARMVSFAGSAPGPQTVLGYLAQPKGASRAPGVVIVHENRGLLDHFKDVARRLAKLGYAAVAVDLLSGAGGTDKIADSAEASSRLGQMSSEELVSMPAAAVRYLRSLPAVRADRVGAMGFCFGGGVTWRVTTQVPDLRATAPFYGSNPPLTEVPNIRAAVLAFYGALDSRLDAGIPDIRAALDRARIVYQIVVEPGAGHAFFNDTGAGYNAAAAQDAWTRLQAWFKQYLQT